MELEDLLSLIMSARIMTSYRGPTIKFIIDWLDYICHYEALVPTKSRFHRNMKKAMLQNALQGHDAFLNATQIESYSIAQGNGPLDFEAYVGLVQKLQHSMTTLSTSLCMLSSFTRPIRTKSMMIHLRMKTNPLDLSLCMLLLDECTRTAAQHYPRQLAIPCTGRPNCMGSSVR